MQLVKFEKLIKQHETSVNIAFEWYIDYYLPLSRDGRSGRCQVSNSEKPNSQFIKQKGQSATYIDVHE